MCKIQTKEYYVSNKLQSVYIEEDFELVNIVHPHAKVNPRDHELTKEDTNMGTIYRFVNIHDRDLARMEKMKRESMHCNDRGRRDDIYIREK